MEILNYLYPQRNEFRDIQCLNGLWDFSVNQASLPGKDELSAINYDRTISVPGSWNEQFTDLHNHMGLGWYRRTVFLNKKDENIKVYLRIGAACNHSRVWINNKFIGKHRLGYLPGVFDRTDSSSNV